MTIRHTSTLAFEDSGGPGAPIVLLPGAGDIREGYAPLAATLRAAGYRTVLADLPGHGDSPPAPTYGVGETATALLGLIDEVDAGPVTVVATSFSPAAAVVAAERSPQAFSALVSISPHMEAGAKLSDVLQGIAIRGLLRGAWAGALWGRLYRNWYKAHRPDSLDSHILRLQTMLAEPERRRAVRDTLVADRDGVAEALGAIDLPLLYVFGSDDDHFPDPAAEAEALVARTGGERLLVPGAGHYPHIEYPDVVGAAIVDFLQGPG